MSYSIDRDPNPAVVERSVRYAATVDDLPAAWAFVMDKLDDPLIGKTPTIKISPAWKFTFTPFETEDDSTEPELYFSVVVDGWVDLSEGES